MTKRELIETLEMYGDSEIIFSFASCDYNNIDIYEYKGKIIIDIDEMDFIDSDYLEISGHEV